jgi:hypothetical protein
MGRTFEIDKVAGGDGYERRIFGGEENLSCRIARCAKERGEDVYIIAILEEIAARGGVELRDRLGSLFVRGHKEASGGWWIKMCLRSL